VMQLSQMILYRGDDVGDDNIEGDRWPEGLDSLLALDDCIDWKVVGVELGIDPGVAAESP
jgi:hypothetical protein